MGIPPHFVVISHALESSDGDIYNVRTYYDPVGCRSIC